MKCDGCGHAAHPPQCCTHRSLSGGASGMVQVCACGRGMVGDPMPTGCTCSADDTGAHEQGCYGLHREPRYRTLADRQWAEAEPPQTRWEMTRGYGTY